MRVIDIKKIERIGKINTNKFGSNMKIVEYNSSNSTYVEFEQGNRVHTSYEKFMLGSVKNPYDPSIFNIGYIGEGDYKASINRRHTPQYSVWKSMLERCYSEKWKKSMLHMKIVTLVKNGIIFKTLLSGMMKIIMK